ncbi:hypothetical protein ACIL5K_RS01505 [Escherichia coli]
MNNKSTQQSIVVSAQRYLACIKQQEAREAVEKRDSGIFVALHSYTAMLASRSAEIIEEQQREIEALKPQQTRNGEEGANNDPGVNRYQIHSQRPSVRSRRKPD